MLVSISVKPGEKIYYFDTTEEYAGEVLVSYVKVISTDNDVEIQYRDANTVFDVLICTEKELTDKISRDGVLYFKNKFVRDAYKDKFMKKVN